MIVPSPKEARDVLTDLQGDLDDYTTAVLSDTSDARVLAQKIATRLLDDGNLQIALAQAYAALGGTVTRDDHGNPRIPPADEGNPRDEPGYWDDAA